MASGQMTSMKKAVLGLVLEANQRVVNAAANGTDWLFKRDTLIQSGRTWYELVHDGDLMAVRFYGLPGEDHIELTDGATMPIKRDKYDLPLVLVPPLGVTTEVFDRMPMRSLVRYMVASGFKVYLVDWGKPGKRHARLGFEDYAHQMLGTALEKIVKHSGSKELSLMGWCMGGILSLLYQGLVLDKRVRNIVTVASPIDLEGGSGVVSKVAGVAQALNAPAQLVSRYTDLRLNNLDPAKLSQPDWVTTLVFKLTDPVGSVTTYWDLVTHLWDREFVESHTTTSDYLNNMLRYPGGVLKDMVEGVAVDNRLAQGRLGFADGVVKLRKIRSNMLVFAGETDHLVPPDVVEKGVGIFTSSNISYRLAKGGHMGVIVGSKAQESVWKDSATWLARRSAASKARKSRGRAQR